MFNMSKKRKITGIVRITSLIIIMGLTISLGKWISNLISYPEFLSSSAAYHVVYGDDEERLNKLNKKAQQMGYLNFNDYRVKTW